MAILLLQPLLSCCRSSVKPLVAMFPLKCSILYHVYVVGQNEIQVKMI